MFFEIEQKVTSCTDLSQVRPVAQVKNDKFAYLNIKQMAISRLEEFIRRVQYEICNT